MSAPDFAACWQALAERSAGVSGVKVVMGANDGAAEQVVPLADEIVDTPAIVYAPGEWSNIAGGASRIRMQWLGNIFVPREAPGDGATEVLRIFAALLVAHKAAKPASAGSLLQSALITTGPGLLATEWPPESNSWYLTWPFNIDAVWNPNALVYTAD